MGASSGGGGQWSILGADEMMCCKSCDFTDVYKTAHGKVNLDIKYPSFQRIWEKIPQLGQESAKVRDWTWLCSIGSYSPLVDVQTLVCINHL